MKLHHNPASPFVRMVTVTAREAGLADQIEEVFTGVFLPITAHEGVVSDSPLGKIPTLVTDDGMALFDSRVICEYLADLAPEKELLPASGAARWKCLSLQALGQGLADTAVNLRYETALRPEELQWSEWIDAQRARIGRSLDALANDRMAELADVTVGSISAAVCLGYMDFRYPDEDWRASRPALADWYAGFAERPSMKATDPAVLI